MNPIDPILTSQRAGTGEAESRFIEPGDRAWAERFFEMSVDLLAMAGYDGRLKRVNPHWERLLGWSEKELLSRPYLEFIHPDDRERTIIRARELMSDHPPGRDLEVRFESREGGYRWLSVSGQTNPTERVIYIVAKDITARRRAEEALRNNEARFRTVVSALDEGIILQDADGVIQASNEAAERIFGLSAEDLWGRTAMDVSWRMVREDGSPFPRTDLPAMRTLRTGEPMSHVVVGLEQPEGALTWISLNTYPLRNPEERAPHAVVSSFTDITERKRAEDALRDATERFRVAFDAAPIGIAIMDLDGRFIEVNHALCELTGHEPEELAGRPFQEITHPDDVARQLKENRRLLANDARTYEIEKRYLHKAGGEVWARLTTTLVRAPDDSPLYFLQQIQDVTARRAAEAALRESEARFRSMTESASEAIVGADSAGRILSWNTGAERMFQYSAAEVLGQSVTMLMPERFRARHAAGLRRIRETGVSRLAGHTLELAGLRRDGEEFPLELSLSSWTVQGERFFGGIARDITNRKEAEAELERSNADLSQFASVASHDLREPLVVVKGYLELLAQRHAEALDPEGRRFLGFAVDAVTRMQSLIADLLQWSRAGAELERRPVDAGQLASDALAAVQHHVEQRGATVTLGEMPTVRAEPTALRRVFQNLLSNAVKFGAEEDPRIAITSHREEDRWRFTIADNGPGIPSQDRERVFVMFERLGAPQKGTGIGLPICRRIVERHGGRMWVGEASGGGAAFHFTIRD